MIEAEAFTAAALARGFDTYSGVPCSYLTPFINYAIQSDSLRYIGAANEGDAVAIAAGATLGGHRAVAMFQNSGLGNAVSPLTSLTWTFRIPILLIVSWRGQPGGPEDEPQHELMGAVTPEQLELMDISWRSFPDNAAAIAPALATAEAHMAETGRPFALVMSKGAVAPGRLVESPEVPPHAPARPPALSSSPPDWTRRDALAALQAAVGPETVVIASTGFAGRELYALDDRDNQLYMVGSMGCASSLGLGLALARPDRQVVVVDGDGAALMRLGAMATIGAEAPANLCHLLIDNGMHESTGGQATASATTDFCAVAAACGYSRVGRAVDAPGLTELLAPIAAGPRFIHLPVKPGTPDNLPRPTVSPEAVAQRFRDHLGAVPERRPAA